MHSLYTLSHTLQVMTENQFLSLLCHIREISQFSFAVRENTRLLDFTFFFH